MVLGMNSLVFVVVIVSSFLVLCAGAVALAVCICRRDGHRARAPHLQSAQQQPPNAPFPCKCHTSRSPESSTTACQQTVAFHLFTCITNRGLKLLKLGCHNLSKRILWKVIYTVGKNILFQNGLLGCTAL